MKGKGKHPGAPGVSSYDRDIIPHIEANYETFTTLERTIADYFIARPAHGDLSAKAVAKQLYVSEASLSRFAQKCGYSGYREFLIYYKNGGQTAGQSAHPPSSSGHVNTVLHTYQELLSKSYALIDEEQMKRVARTLAGKKFIYVYGRGSSGLVAMEMRIRFMRIGLNVESIVDSHIMRMNSVLLNPDCAVIGISVSGKTKDVTAALKAAKGRGAYTVLISAYEHTEFQQDYDEVLLCSAKERLENSKAISPQFPVLIMVDVLFSELMELDHSRSDVLHEYTLAMLDKGSQA